MEIFFYQKFFDLINKNSRRNFIRDNLFFRLLRVKRNFFINN